MSSDFEIDIEVYYLVSTFFFLCFLNMHDLDTFSVLDILFSQVLKRELFVDKRKKPAKSKVQVFPSFVLCFLLLLGANEKYRVLRIY